MRYLIFSIWPPAAILDCRKYLNLSLGLQFYSVIKFLVIKTIITPISTDNKWNIRFFVFFSNPRWPPAAILKTVRFRGDPFFCNKYDPKNIYIKFGALFRLFPCLPLTDPTIFADIKIKRKSNGF